MTLPDVARRKPNTAANIAEDAIQRLEEENQEPSILELKNILIDIQFNFPP